MKVREVYLLQLSLIPAGNAKGSTTPPRRLALVSGKGWNLSKGKGNREGGGGGNGEDKGVKFWPADFFFFLIWQNFCYQKNFIESQKGR